MAFIIDWVQPASGDSGYDPLGIAVSRLRFLARALAGPGQDGVIAPSQNVVQHRAAGANMSVDIQPFTAIIAGDDVSDQGSYVIVNTSVYNLATPAAPPSGTRTHRLVAQVRDHRCNPAWPAGTYDWTPVIQQDSGGGIPDANPSAGTLAAISIASGQSSVADSNITNNYVVLGSLAQPSNPGNSATNWQSWQGNAGSWNITDAWTDYSAGNWPAVTFTAPPSGAVWVTIGAGLIVAAGNTAVGWRMSGGKTVDYSWSRSFGAGAAGTWRGSRRTMVTGIPPGSSCTVTAGWRQGQPGNSDQNEGQLYVEAV